MKQPGTIPADTLYAYTLFFLALIILILIATHLRLAVRKKRFLLEKKVQDFFDQWLSNMLLDDFSGGVAVEIPEELKDIRKNKIARQYAINQLINTKKNLVGIASRNVVYLYEQLGLKTSSLRKFNSRIWYKKAKGIYELYMMEQKDVKDRILRYTNSSNEYIRLEAQTAVLAFSGFEGLAFLDRLTRPMNSWQQVKLLEQLEPLDPGHLEPLENWLLSKNNSVVIFALKLAEIYQQYHLKEAVTGCLQHENEKVRTQAIKTLRHIGDEQSAQILAERYAEETMVNRTAILQALENIATDQQKAFLEKELSSGNTSIQLQVARVIAKCCTNGMAELQERPGFRQIFLHIKSEMAR